MPKSKSPPSTPVKLRIPTDLLASIKKRAEASGLGYQTYIIRRLLADDAVQNKAQKRPTPAPVAKVETPPTEEPVQPAPPQAPSPPTNGEGPTPNDIGDDWTSVLN